MNFIVSDYFRRVFEGSSKSGNFDHAGRPGLVGGSAENSSPGMAFDETDEISQAFLHGELNSPIKSMPGKYKSSYGIDPANGNEGDKFLRSKLTFYTDANKYYDDKSEFAAAIKKDLCRDISEESGLDEELVNSLMERWAESSNDHDYASLMIQKSASEEFGIPLSSYQQINIEVMEDAFNSYSTVVPNLTPELIEKIKDNSRKGFDFIRNLCVESNIANSSAKNIASFFTNEAHIKIATNEETKLYLRAVYNRTQKAFKDAGITHVLLARGVDAGTKKMGYARLDRNVMESWSSNSGFARMFEGIGHTIFADVPVERVMSTCVTGPGCLTEQEFVVLGGDHDYGFASKRKTFA